MVTLLLLLPWLHCYYCYDGYYCYYCCDGYIVIVVTGHIVIIVTPWLHCYYCCNGKM